jgi:hypothetical protein
MRCLSIISEVLFLAIAIVLVFVVYSMSAPVVQTMQTSSVYEQTKSLMLDVDKTIRDVASQGRGSRSTIYVTTGAGLLTLEGDKDLLTWELETDSDIVSPRSMQKTGNLISGSNLGAMAYENESEGAYVLENERLMVYIKKIGSPSSPQAFNTSDLLMGVYNKDLAAWMDMKRLEISIDDESNSTNGTGYTVLENEGYALSSARVSALINTSYVYMQNYTVTFTLESGADFVVIEAEEQF